MNKVVYKVPNISCSHCVHTIEMELSQLDGVESVKADLETKQVEVNYSDPATEEQITTLLIAINYAPEGA